MDRQNRIVFLRGRKTILRPITKADAPLFVRWMNDPDVRLYLQGLMPFTETGELAWIEGLDKRPNDIVLMVETLDGVPIGSMGLHGIEWVNGVASTGAAFGEKKYWGQGYGQDAKMALLHYAFHTLNLRKICSACYAFNRRSAAYNQRCGYRIEGRLRRQVYRRGRYYDLIQLCIFRPWFEAKWKRYQRTGKL